MDSPLRDMKKKEVFTVKEHTRFQLARIENVERVTTALAQSGFLVSIEKKYDGVGFDVIIYYFS